MMQRLDLIPRSPTTYWIGCSPWQVHCMPPFQDRGFLPKYLWLCPTDPRYGHFHFKNISILLVFAYRFQFFEYDVNIWYISFTELLPNYLLRWWSYWVFHQTVSWYGAWAHRRTNQLQVSLFKYIIILYFHFMIALNYISSVNCNILFFN